MSRRARRWSALGGLVVLAACARWVVGPDPGTDPASIFDTVWADFDAHYSFFDLKGIDWDSLYTVYQPRAARARDDAQLFDALSGLLAELDDVHVILNAGASTYHYEPPYPNNFDSLLVYRTYVRGARRTRSGRIHYGWCAADTGVGYIAIASFTGEGWADEVDGVLAHLAGARALIVDVRGNGGGDVGTARGIAARFADRERTFGYIRYRNGPRHSDFTGDIAEVVAPGGARRFTGPVIVLTNRHVYSAAEEFVLAMHALPTVTTLGDTTGGGSGNPIVRELPNGWTYQISQWIEYTPDGRTFEGVGLTPDVVVQESALARQHGYDRVISAAVRRLGGG